MSTSTQHETSRMVDAFMAAGFTYFDTAYVYNGSEEAARKALVERYPRESYTLATKLNARVAQDVQDAHSQLEQSLARTGAGYFDYYLLHAVQDSNARHYAEWGLWDFVEEQKAAGRIRHYGFSFHGTPALLDRLLTEHPGVDIVQLQINYADWENPEVAARENYEVARRHGKQIVIMEPVKGGALADPPQEVKALFDAARPGASYASWALRFAASLDGVLAVLSGMSDTAQMQDNLATFASFAPMDEADRASRSWPTRRPSPAPDAATVWRAAPGRSSSPRCSRRPTSSWARTTPVRPKKPMPGPSTAGAKPPTASAAASARGPAPSTCR